MTREVSLTSVAQRNQDIVEATIEGETVMMSIDTGQYYGLDSVASEIWQMLEQPIKVEAICTQLLQEYDVDTEQCEQDVLAFLQSLQEQNIIDVNA